MDSWKKGSLACFLICPLPLFYLIKAEAFYNDEYRCLQVETLLERKLSPMGRSLGVAHAGYQGWLLYYCPGSTLPSAPSHLAPTVFSFLCSVSQRVEVLGTSASFC